MAFDHYPSLVDGELVTGERGDIMDPATERAFASYGIADEALVSRAATSARRAFAPWRTTPLAARRQILQALADAIAQNRSGLSHLLTREQGKPAHEAAGEVAAAHQLLAYYATLHPDRSGDLYRDEVDGYRRIYAPIGVVAGIVPWNMPLMLAAAKIGPALLTGNTIIVKPAPTTPATTLAFARLAQAIVPPGVLQILGDGGAIGPLLTEHPLVDKIAFTGSTASGTRVMASAAAGLKKLTLELGGNDAAIVLADADIDAAAAAICASSFENCGQVCAAVKRVYVDATVHDAFAAALAGHVRRLKVGHGLTPGVDVGPLQNRAQFDKASALFLDAAASGTILAQADPHHGAGFFVTPTVFEGLADDHPLVIGEQFAPLLPVLSFTSEAAAVERANATTFGLTASIWSRDVTRARDLAHHVEASLIGINKHNQCAIDMAIGLGKQSGMGWLLGDSGIKEFLQPRLINHGD